LLSATDYLDIGGDQSHRSVNFGNQKTPKFIEASILENEMPPP